MAPGWPNASATVVLLQSMPDPSSAGWAARRAVLRNDWHGNCAEIERLRPLLQCRIHLTFVTLSEIDGPVVETHVA